MQYLQASWNGEVNDMHKLRNPCEKVTLNEEKVRIQNVEDWQYQLVQDMILQTTRSPYLAVMMEFAYLCRLRCAEVRDLKHSDIKNGTIRIVHGKGSTGELTRLSPRLLAAVNSAKSINPDAPSPITGAYLLHDTKGLKINKNKFDSAWKRVMEKAVNECLKIDGKILRLEEVFKFHDLKAKGVSDHTENHSGHKSEKARQIYIRKLKEVDATR